MSQRFPVTDQAMADVLRRDQVDLLRHFVGRENTVTEAARAARIPVRRMFYWVERFVDVGLLTVVRLEPRRGRPIKHYRAVATSFELSPELVPPSLLDTEWRREAEAAARAMREEFPFDADDTVVHIEFSPDGAKSARNYVPRRFLRQPREEPSTWFASERWMTREDAYAFSQALRTVYEEFERKKREPGTPGTDCYRSLLMVVRDPQRTAEGRD